ncbi:MAG: methyltransferase domain-containing protein [Nocardiopsis sp. BM-2018]|nr:MAG: methyltransferase domain-containing protein [Nocardiopsis sp. BM-2018]
MDARTEKARELWEGRAKSYDTGVRIEPAGIRNTRRLLCGGARGRTLEVAVGTGMNLEHYPPQVKLTGVDLSPAMLERARERAEEQGRPVTLVEGDAQALDFADQSFDTVLCALALCTIPDQGRALAEMHRVLVPGGRLLLVDHIEYTRFPFRLLERLRKHPRRLPRTVAEEAGFEVGHHDRLLLGMVERLVAHRPH